MGHHLVGIDLGTTNCALAWRELNSDSPGEVLAIPQLTAPGTIEKRLLLASSIYVAKEGEFPDAGLALPWHHNSAYAVGEFARTHGAKVPFRLIESAKSWLSHSAVDRTGPLLPWQAPREVERISPIEASARYLEHLAGAWTHLKEAGLKSEEIILTVPASFDAAARELTMQAAAQAGLHNVTLLEEPQAALYAWLDKTGADFRKQVRVGDVILVVDVGGGTTDFSLIAVTEQDGDLQLTRMAVGDHILLGGDNMDLTLAHHLAQEKPLDAWQFTVLTHGCRQAKELIFRDAKVAKVPISVPGRSSALIGRTIKFELTREDVSRILVDGFIPRVSITDLPRTARRTGLTQLGLPYAQDPAITRHLAAFLTRQSRIAEGKSFVHPSAILFNGGVFKASVLRTRIIEVVNAWLADDSGSPVKELEGADLDLAVARGAAYYAWVRHGHGIRIRGGTARAYYVGVEAATPAVPGFEPPVRALCVAPFGMEEGSVADVPSQEFALVVGEPTTFRFLASSVRREDRVGDMIDDALRNDEFEEVAPIETTLSGESGRLVPIHLQAAVTEIGTLELRCLEKDGPGRWNLELNLRTKED
jgi:molecular chaperone DnaK (HSP70)